MVLFEGLAHSWLRLAEYLERAEAWRSEEHTSELQSHVNLVCRLLLEKKNTTHALRDNVARGEDAAMEDAQRTIGFIGVGIIGTPNAAVASEMGHDVDLYNDAGGRGAR